ncbi:MAG: serine--tRNA ligase [Akkermansia sp.]|nr:serine--tRNA ligase [Akkermansia sp.]MDO4954005.1 serine--tRNA ligase [Akkermansia sp.]
MLDIRIVREKPDYVKERVRLRGGDHWMLVDKVLECDERRRAAETEKQALSQERNSSSKLIGQMMKEGRRDEAEELKKRMGEVGDRIKELDAICTAAGEEQEQLLLSIPNMPHDGAPVGLDETANPELRQWGSKPEIAEPKDHVEIGTRLGLLNFEDAARISGSGFIVYRGLGARLERALINFLLDTQTLENGYQETGVPFMVRRECMYGTGQLPKFEEDMYGLEENQMFMVPTAEVPVTNLCRDQIVKEGDLPIKMTAYTPCFRREAGSAGRENKGMIRVHQFDKVELVEICKPEDGWNELEKLTGHAESILQKLGLHYRVIELCTGDVGFSSAKTYDIEVWAPGQGKYLEVSSCSCFTDYQARRMKLRYKGADGKIHIPYTLNGSGTALPRLYVALLEQCQQPDGSVRIPQALVPYFGADCIKPQA